MIKASLLIMLLLTVLVGMGLRWRQGRLEASRLEATRLAPAPRGRRAAGRPGLLARGKAGIDLWITAAAVASVATILLMGGLHWIKVWLQ
jgi:hypothetical protein